MGIGGAPVGSATPSIQGLLDTDACLPLYLLSQCTAFPRLLPPQLSPTLSALGFSHAKRFVFPYMLRWHVSLPPVLLLPWPQMPLPPTAFIANSLCWPNLRGVVLQD